MNDKIADKEIMESVKRQTRDVRAAAATLGKLEARYLVSQYYYHQKSRIRQDNWIKAQEGINAEHATLDWLATQSDVLERQIKASLERYAQAHPVGRWMLSIKGVGPVISAGLLANVDITRSNTVGKLWALCGVAPALNENGNRRDRRVRGEKLSYNPDLKLIVWHAGACFKRLSKDDPNAFYRTIYDERKLYETRKNEAGDYADQAKQLLATRKIESADLKALYEAGKLSPAHIDARCMRYAAKLFLAHLHEVWWKTEVGTQSDFPYPKPYPIAFLGHVDKIEPPNFAG